jgi:hypothetical protein
MRIEWYKDNFVLLLITRVLFDKKPIILIFRDTVRTRVF